MFRFYEAAVREIRQRPVPDGEVVQDLIVWATALLPKPDRVVTAATRRVPTPRSNDVDAGARRNRRPETVNAFGPRKHPAGAAAGTGLMLS